MDQIKIGGFLKQLRKEKGLTQEVLAEKLLVSNRTVSRWETGSNMPDLDVLVELAKFHEVELSELLNGERSQQKMDKQLEETVLKVADYSNQQQEKWTKRMCMMFCAAIFFALIALAAEFVHPVPDSTMEHLCGFFKGFGGGVSLGMLIIGVLITSGKAEKLLKAKKRLIQKMMTKE